MTNKKVVIEKNIFDQDYFLYLKDYFSKHSILEKDEYHYYGSKRIDSYNDTVLAEAQEKIIEKAKQIFMSDTLVPSYSIFSEYSGSEAYLNEHYDVGPCTYTIDLCLYQKTSWPLFIENEKYEWGENEAIFFYPNDQLHWKEDFPDKENNKVGLLFFHFVEPDHAWLKLPDSVKKYIRNTGKLLK